MYLFLAVLRSDWILVGETQGVRGSMCMSVDRSWRRRPSRVFMISVWEGVGLCPNALEVKAFQRVVMAADCRDHIRQS